jgi:chromosome segregation ATPase
MITGLFVLQADMLCELRQGDNPMTEAPDEAWRRRNKRKELRRRVQKLERALDHQREQAEHAALHAVLEQLREMGEISTYLKLYLYELHHVPETGQRLRDLCNNLKGDLERLVTQMTNNKETKPDAEEAQPEPVKGKDASLLEEKIKEARGAIADLEEQIKYFDRIERDLSTKLEILESRRVASKAGALLGGLLIFVGGIIITGGLLLTLAPFAFPFVYSAFDTFFNFLLIFLGSLMVASGFLHQT